MISNCQALWFQLKYFCSHQNNISQLRIPIIAFTCFHSNSVICTESWVFCSWPSNFLNFYHNNCKHITSFNVNGLHFNCYTEYCCHSTKDSLDKKNGPQAIVQVITTINSSWNLSLSLTFSKAFVKLSFSGILVPELSKEQRVSLLFVYKDWQVWLHLLTFLGKTFGKRVLIFKVR